jgi:hypothetical protein
MNKHRKFQTAASLGTGLLLLAAALTAWGITVTLQDGTTSIICTTTDVTTIDPAGDITVPVAGGCLPTGDGGGDPPPGSFTLSVSKTGSGAVTSTPAGINCGATCSAPYSDGTPVSLTATPASGSTFGGWGGACTGTGACNLSMTANRSVTATFTADSVGNCPAPGPDVTIVDTGTFNGSWPQQTVFPTPQNIAAYKVVVPAGVSAINTFSTARTSAGLRAKLLVVSECPGSFEPVGGQSRCTAPNPQETSTVSLTTIENRFRCNLTPGTYYVNAASKASLTDAGFTCSNTTSCSYFVSRTRN